MYYLTFLMKDPESQVVKCVGVKYKKTPFNASDLDRIAKNGTSNQEIKSWIKSLKDSSKVPAVEVLYQGTDSAEACYHKQQVLINHENVGIELLGIKISTKKYTKKLRVNEDMRRSIIDQRGVQYSGVLEAGEKLLLAPSNISKVLHGKLDHIGGYKFRFVDEVEEG
jgi:hypothetical protein